MDHKIIYEADLHSFYNKLAYKILYININYKIVFHECIKWMDVVDDSK